MKPRTKIQKEVDRLSEAISPLSKEQEQYAIDKAFKCYMFKLKERAICLKCGNEWEDKRPKEEIMMLKGNDAPICPKCGKRLFVWKDRKRVNIDIKYIHKLEVVNNYQVVRIFYIDAITRVHEEARYNLIEVAQHWIRDDGKNVVRAILRNNFGWGGERWCWGTDMEVRQANDAYYVYPDLRIPHPKILPTLRRNGYTGNFHSYNPIYFFELLLKSSMFETLLKAKRYDLLKEYSRSEVDMEKYWSAIKMVIRNNYIITDAQIWLDHLRSLEQLNMDCSNPKYVLPKDLHKEHRLISRRIERKLDREREERRRLFEQQEIEKRKREEETFYKTKARYFDLRFSNARIEVVPLKSIDEFREEAEEMGHCVFSNAYYGKVDSLILSARKGNRRIATIEVDLKEMEVLQCRGRFNNPTRYDAQITRLINENIPIIKKIAHQTIKA